MHACKENVWMAQPLDANRGSPLCNSPYKAVAVYDLSFFIFFGQTWNDALRIKTSWVQWIEPLPSNGCIVIVVEIDLDMYDRKYA